MFIFSKLINNICILYEINSSFTDTLRKKSKYDQAHFMPQWHA